MARKHTKSQQARFTSVQLLEFYESVITECKHMQCP